MGVMWLALLVACFPDPEPVASDPCVGCHGSPETGPAPPAALGGATDPALIGVGSHEAHVGGGVACEECHLVPGSVDAEGHTDTPWPAEVGWGDIGKAGGAALPWDRGAATCTVWCHGAGLEGGTEVAPSWTDTDGSASQCGACHAIPDVPAGQSCGDCHGDLTPATHVDGQLDCGVPGATGPGACPGCSDCHGGPGDTEPFRDTSQKTDPTLVSVGAHEAHLSHSGLAAPVGCWACHAEVDVMHSEGHVDSDLPAEVRWGPVGATGALPWDRADRTCTVWCHGAELEGGSQPPPSWTETGGIASSCGACHGLPPPAPHGQSGLPCEGCHGPLDATNHIDGIVTCGAAGEGLPDALGTCGEVACGFACHGTADSPAPPFDTSGSADTADRGVGAHATHLAGGVFSAPVACVNCHIEVLGAGQAGHADTPVPAEVVWGGVAASHGVTPVFDPVGLTCSVGCHLAAIPVWTEVGTGQAACGTCHSLPPAAPHPGSNACETCHASTAGPNQTIANPANHVNGVVDF